MWIFTKIGFFSAVSAMKNGEVDYTRVVVRARNREHLVNLNDILGTKASKISTSKNTDYPCRIILSKEVWAQICKTLAEGIDYTNFKGAIDDHIYHDALMRVWSEMRDYQDEIRP